MRDTALEEKFAELEADALTIFRPPGVAAAQRRVRQRRRWRRGLLAGITALLVGTPAGALAVAGRHDRLPITPPSPTVTPAGALTERKVVVPGAAGGLTDLRFVDARHGWALFDTCTRETPTGCRRTVGRTTDGGATWQGRELPVTDGMAYLQPRDDRTLTVVAGQRYLVTTDGGATFTSHRVETPAEAARVAPASPSGFRLACPADKEALGQDCARFHLARVDDAPVPRQPPLALDADAAAQLVEGGDGRLWLATMKNGRSTVVVTDDQAKSWRKLSPVPAPAFLTVSPDGAEAWLVDGSQGGSVWRLAGDRWQQRPGLPDDTGWVGAVAAAGDGLLVVTSRYGGAGFWTDGRFLDLPELREALRGDSTAEARVEVLRDGSVLFSYGRTQIIGTGRGAERTWTRFS